MPVADPLKKQIAQKARLHMKICISCGARLDINATPVSYTHLTLPTTPYV